MDRKLYRSRKDKVIAGVCGGLGEYFDVDPVFVRIIVVLLAFAHGFGLLGYIIAWIIIPKKEEAPDAAVEEGTETKVRYSSWNRYLPGLILIGIGIILLLRDNLYWFDWDEFWPVVLVVIGLYLIFRRKRNRETEESLNSHIHGSQEIKHENGGTN
ncbi:MAG TPA: PspC domain-containing protein [candidate division Zixibacteria bacterium]|nr:PspC domain-containing protein [candidate division Zixibacteria bacterium]